MKSKTKILKQAQRKKNSELIESILIARKNQSWKRVSEILSRPRRLMTKLNLDQIEQESKEGDTIVVPGKVLSQGDISKKIKIAAVSFSEKALEKLKNKKCEVADIKQEIKENPQAQGVKVLEK